MALLPAESLLDGTKTPATTTSEMKGALGTLRRYLSDFLGVDSTDKAAARSALGAAPVVSAVLTKNVAGNVDTVLLPIEAINDILILTGALTANISVIVPNTAKTWNVWNKTTGAYALTLKTVAGAGIVIAQGKKRDLWCDGADVLAGLTDFSDMPVANVIRVRHCVQYGPLTTPAVGQPAQPDLIPQSQINNLLAAGVTLKCSVAPTFFSAAAGFNADGSQNDISWLATTDIAVPGLPASTAGIVIWVDPALKTAGFYPVTDGFQAGGAIPIAPANTMTFDWLAMKNYVATGTAANQSNKLPVVEVDTDGTKVIAIRVRPYLGRYISPSQPLIGGAQAQSVNHNSGFIPNLQYMLKNITAENGYVPGEFIPYSNFDNGGQAENAFVSRIYCGAVSTGSLVASSKSGGARVGLTPANWNIIYSTIRPW